MHADVAGYSRLIGLDDAGTLRRLRALREAVIDPAIAAHRGRIVNTAGDSLLIVFDSARGAVQCALRMQGAIPVHDSNAPADRCIRFRVGITVGDVISDGTDVHGDGVNIAARLESASPIGGICVSRPVRDQVQAQLDLDFVPLGSLVLKNIAVPVEAFALRLDGVAPPPAAVSRRWAWPVALAGLAALLLVSGGGTAWWLRRAPPGPAVTTAHAPAAPASAFVPPDVGISRAPQLSLVVLPFDNLGGDTADNYLVDGISEDLTTDLARVPGMLVIARTSAFTYRGRGVDAKRIGEELGVRYVLEGSVRRFAAGLRVNAQLVSTENGTHLWADRFDASLENISAAQDEIVIRIGRAMNVQLIDIESARAVRERPGNPDAFDLILQARALANQPPSPTRDAAVQALYQRALDKDPKSVPAMLGIAGVILARAVDVLSQFVTADERERAAALFAAARAEEPDSEQVLVTAALLAQSEDRWDELAQAAQFVVDRFPNRLLGYELLATAKRYSGHADQAIGLYEKSIRLDPRSPTLYLRYGYLGYALYQVRRYAEAVDWFRRSLIANPEAPVAIRAARMRLLAGAMALDGRRAEAQRAMTEATQLWPFATLRANSPENLASAVLREEILRVVEGLRQAGLRDHADESADFGIAADGLLHGNLAGYTPTTAPGIITISTAALADLITARRPLAIDPMTFTWGRSIPGAIGLRNAGTGGRFDDGAQAQLERKMRALAAGDMSRPVVAIGFNSERFDGRNLALRLARMGFTEVYWYRGGRETWEFAGLEEAPLYVQGW
jgi:TolB-like protein/class 3 adenylate cyclase